MLQFIKLGINVSMLITVLFWDGCDKKQTAPPRPAKPLPLANPFFAMDTGTKDSEHQTFAAQAEMIAQLGYDGFGHTDLDNLQALLAALDEHNLKLFTIYLGVNLDDTEKPFDPRLGDAIKLLDGRGTILWLYVVSSNFDRSSPDADPVAVQIVRKISDLAAGTDVKIAFYPHTSLWLETTADALRLAEKVNRPNVGVTFNLCHHLRVIGPEKVEQTLQAAFPHLFVVTINGADSAPAQSADWDRLIQPLDTGTYDVLAVLKKLRVLNYTGPVGLQHYGIKGSARENLARSISAWKKLSTKTANQ